jgi:hypothetical protein
MVSLRDSTGMIIHISDPFFISSKESGHHFFDMLSADHARPRYCVFLFQLKRKIIATVRNKTHQLWATTSCNFMQQLSAMWSNQWSRRLEEDLKQHKG